MEEDDSSNILMGRHVCPSCGKVELTFEDIGYWS